MKFEVVIRKCFEDFLICPAVTLVSGSLKFKYSRVLTGILLVYSIYYIVKYGVVFFSKFLRIFLRDLFDLSGGPTGRWSFIKIFIAKLHKN